MFNHGKPAHFFSASHTRRFLSVLMLIVVFWGCSQQRETENRQKITSPARSEGVFSDQFSDTLVRELSSDPQYLNPVLSNDSQSSHVQDLLYEGMITIDGTPESNYVGRLAENWLISDDNLQITFFLRKGIKWHDGEPFTAEDVKFTFDTAARSDIPSFGKKATVETIDRIDILDPFTIRFTFKYPFSPALILVGGSSIIPKHRLDEQGLAEEKQRLGSESPVLFVTSEFNRSPIGTGPYAFVEWKTAQHIKLVKNDQYWDSEHVPSIQNVVFKIIPNRTVAYNILQKGELDVFRARPIQYMRFERSDDLTGKFRGLAYYEPNYYYIGWNNRAERKIFSNRQIRLAMSYALDCQAFIDKVLYGLAEPISGPFYMKSWAYNQEIKPIPFDLDKATELLTQEGWVDQDRDGILDRDGTSFDFELILPTGSPTMDQLASIVQANLKRIAIKVNIVQYEWSVYLNLIRKGEFDAYLGGWSLGVDPDPYSIWHSSQIGIGNNYIGFNNAEVDTLLEKGRREFDREKRKQIYGRVHEIIHREQPYTFVHASKETYILSKRLKNVSVSPFGLFGFFPGQIDWRLN
ncbi:peptide-binding protein [bacterium]|nr:peptide-binding protein [bacterium]